MENKFEKEIKVENTRKVFLDDLPRWSKSGKGKEGTINWKESIGCKVKFEYDSIVGEFNIMDYDLKTQKLSLLYLNNDIFKITAGHFRECKLQELLGIKTIKYRYNVGDIVETNTSKIKILKQIRIKSNSNTRDNRTDKGYEYKCLQCECNNESSESHLIELKGCPVCSNQKIVKGINDIATTHPHLVKYFVNKNDTNIYSVGSNVNVEVICDLCNTIKKIRLYDLFRYGIACPKCGDGVSYPNKFMYNMLLKANIKFKNEYSADWCKFKYKGKIMSGKYDFYFELGNKKYIVEMDGGFHNNDNRMNGQTKEESKVIDDCKDKLAEENGIKVIRINCEKSELEYIKNNIINSDIVSIINLNNINWVECHEYACSSRVKETCDLWNSGIRDVASLSPIMKIGNGTVWIYLTQGVELGWCDYKTKSERKIEKIYKSCDLWNSGIKNTNDIGELMNIDKSVIRKYLKEGVKLGICDYTSKEAKQIEGLKRSKSVLCLENGIIFDSVKDVEARSIEIFNLKLISGCVTDACNKTSGKYKGYTFRYIESDNTEIVS